MTGKPTNWPFQILFGNFWWALNIFMGWAIPVFHVKCHIQSKTIKHVNHDRYGPSKLQEHAFHTTSNAQIQISRQSTRCLGISLIAFKLIYQSSESIELFSDIQSAVTNELHSKAKKTGWVTGFHHHNICVTMRVMLNDNYVIQLLINAEFQRIMWCDASCIFYFGLDCILWWVMINI